MSYSQDEVVNEYKKLKARIGHPPDSKTFYRDSPISKAAAEVAFGSKAFSKIQKTAGDERNHASLYIQVEAQMSFSSDTAVSCENSKAYRKRQTGSIVGSSLPQADTAKNLAFDGVRC